MQYTTAILLTAAGLISSASAHGRILTPTPRSPGAAMASACGTQVEGNQASDPNGNIQGMLQVAASQTDYDAAACNIWQCKGYKYADNTDKVQSWTAGEVVPFTFDVAAPHTGTANISIVDTASNTVIKQLLYYSVFASTATGVTANETKFSVTIPEDLGTQCSTAGACIIQHWWDAASIDQTYESCVDFTVGGSAAGSSSSAAVSSVASSTIVASTVAASSSSSVAVVGSSSSAVVSSVSSVAAVITSTASGAVQTTTFAALPTTLATITKASTTSSAAAVATSAAAEEDDDTCDA
ncbi:chitin binding protein [Sclerotinia borealis F-4128]|uniref:Chitin binding protein n=1 Tax=Sclerotinia borealis (strain F-4128) TaxID=1432307 RepID=W9CMD4_SCLBF|nr:chitin binding protein [Sclerotinia borealis F-4128]